MNTSFIEQIKEDLKSFTSTSPLESAKKLLSRLGVRYSTVTDDPIDIGELYKKAATSVKAEIPKSVDAVCDRIETSWFVGGVNEETFAETETQTSFASAEKKADDQKHNGMFIFLLRMKDGAPLSRTDAAQLTRGINRIMKSKPATVIIVEGQGKKTLLSIATCERTTYKQDWRPGEKLGRVSILKGINCAKPHPGHLDILASMNVKKCKTFDALYSQWQKVFSTDLLTKSFYREIQDWYFWAMSKYVCVQFPNDLDDNTDDEKYNAENLIRLITRMLFTWFMKAKGLVNPDLFEPSFLKTALKHFDPEASVEDPNEKDAEKKCTYYRAILQNLFFATFNQEIKERGFVEKKNVLDKKHYHIKNYYRNADLFKAEDQQKIIGYFAKSPFVNGGLFECLDNVTQCDKNKKEHEYSWDGFSNYIRFGEGSRKGSLKSALVPDCLFFGTERIVDLSSFYENNKAAVRSKVRGLVNILNDYVFTIEENTPLDEDVALDPELLGKVFENLLGAYNPETRQMARNATGSFYTPREIVNYMVHVSLAAYLKRACPKVDAKEIDALVEGQSELEKMPSVKGGALDILMALFNAKILDPACGSGAFPMGILTAMVDVLRTIDPDNKHWYKIVLAESLKEIEGVADIENVKERDELKAQIEYDFENRVDFPDYARKLYVIEHCIFGSDIQPIAVQISRLRFFITLLCEQAKTDDANKNYGITPLPNLENNFVAANSLLSIDLKDMRELLGQKKIVSLVRELRAKRHQLFLPKTADRKRQLQKADEKLREKIATAANDLYESVKGEKVAYLKKEIASIKHALATMSEAELNSTQSETQTQMAFSFAEEKTKKGKTYREIYMTRQRKCEKDLFDIQNDDRKKQLLADVKRLVAWNPFAFNVAETFLDPEWMFGVKDGFDVIIANPPYIKEYENRKAFDGFREQSPYYTGKMDIWYGFVCHGVDALKQGGVLCFIAQNNWTTSAGASKMREKVVADTRILQMVDFNDYMVFESAQIQTMIMTFLKDPSDSGFMVEHCTLKEGASVNDVELMLRKKSTENAIYRNIVLSRKDDVSHCLPLFGEMGLIKKIESKSNFTVRECEIVQGIIGNPDDAFKISDLEVEELSEAEMKFVHRFYTHTDRYVTKPGNMNVIYISNKSTPEFVPEKYPGIQDRLLPYKDKLMHRREVENGRLKWYFMHWPRVESVFKVGAKIVWAARTVGRNFTYTDSEFYGSRNLFYLETNRINLKCLVGIYNSSLMFYFMETQLKHLGALLQLDKNQIAKVPLVKPDVAVQNEIAQKVDAIIAAKKSDPSADTSSLEAEIDSLVFDLYGLTAAERAIVMGKGAPS